jgi:hypothetical protein
LVFGWAIVLRISYTLMIMYFNDKNSNVSTLNSTLDYALWTLYQSYFKGYTANIELQVYSVTC